MDTSVLQLQFFWRGTLPAGEAFLVEINDGTWRTVFSRSNLTQLDWRAERIALDTFQPSPSFGVRFRVAGTNGQIGLDHVQLTNPQAI